MAHFGSRVEFIMQAYEDSYAGKKHFKMCEHLRSQSLHCFEGSFLKNTPWGSYLETDCFSVLYFSIFLTHKIFPWIPSAFWIDFQLAPLQGLLASSLHEASPCAMWVTAGAVPGSWSAVLVG